MEFFSFISICFAFCLSISSRANAQSKNCTLTTHDASFIPDVVLRVTSQQMNIGGNIQSFPVVNGTYPGPTVDLTGGQRTWIRVYNDLQGENLTMVGVGPYH